MVKRLLKALYIALLAQKRERKAFKAAKYHLRRGVYCCPLGQKKFCKIGAKGFLPKNFSHIHINFKNKGAHNSVEFGTGYGKAVVLTEDKAYGYYYKKTGYKQAKENFESFYKDFNYPCVTGVSFCDSCLRETMNREKGTVYADKNRDRIVITGMLKFLSEAKTKEKNGKILFLQHADANRVNVLWEKDEKFVFIDLDNIEYYPPMLDVFHYFAVSGYSIEGVMSVLNGQEEVLKKICLKAGIDPDKNMLDELFAGYVSHYKKLGANYEDIGFLNSGNTEQFPKTRELLTEMGL